jgi:hypothetical protein
MSLLPGAKRALHKQPEQLEGWYWEPEWCSESLFARVAFEGPIHDPFCGQGRIVRAARAAGYEATGSDLCDRGFEHAEVGINFLKDWTPRKTLVFNPPSPPWDKDYVDKCIAHALHVASCVASIVAIPYLAGQAHYWMFYRPLPPALVLVHSERPSMPPGGQGIQEKGGTRDYCWIIWRKSHQGPTVIDWLEPREQIPLPRWFGDRLHLQPGNHKKHLS